MNKFNRILRRFLQRPLSSANPLEKLTSKKFLTGFSLVEIVIVVIVLVILAVSALAIYKNFIRKSEQTEAIVNLNAIKIAEEMEVLTDGTYINASDTEEINKLLATELVERIYRYRVENATDDSYVAIAERIDGEGEINETIILAMGPQYGGIPRFVYHGPAISGGAAVYGDSILGKGFSGFGGGGSSAGSSSGGGAIGGGGSSGGGGGTSGGGAGDDGGGGARGRAVNPRKHSNSVCGNSSCEYDESCLDCSGDCSPCVSGQAIIDQGLVEAFNLLASASSDTSATGQDLTDVLNTFEVPLHIGYAQGAIAYWNPTDKFMMVDTDYFNDWTTGAIAAIIAHEANHAEYTYSPALWIAETRARHPEVPLSDIHIDVPPKYSLDQEYNSFKKATEVWTEVKDGTNTELDFEVTFVNQGESYAKDVLLNLYPYGPISASFPEY